MLRTLSVVLVFFVLAGCSSVRVTRTDKTHHNPTDPNKVEIVLIQPQKPYEEIGTVKVTGFGTSGEDTAKMYNAIRAKAAPLGANAVILTNQGNVTGAFTVKMWAQGVAIRYKTEGAQK